MVEIKKLNFEIMKGQKYELIVSSNKYLSIETSKIGFTMEWVESKETLKMVLKDTILSDWLENPIAYGAYEGDKLLGFVEGFLQEWNNRFLITNIIVFNETDRRTGTGKKLLDKIVSEASKKGARMVTLETQSYNAPAISFYEKNGFEIIGFDRFAYSNNGPQEHNMEILMGKKIQQR